MFAFQANIKILSLGEEESKYRVRVMIEYAGKQYKAVIATELLQNLVLPTPLMEAAMYVGTRLRGIGEGTFTENYFNVIALVPIDHRRYPKEVEISGFPVRLVQGLTPDMKSPGVFIVFSILNVDADSEKSLTYCRAYNDVARTIKDFYETKDAEKFSGHLTITGYFRPWHKSGIIFRVTSFKGVTSSQDRKKRKNNKNKELNSTCQN